MSNKFFSQTQCLAEAFHLKNLYDYLLQKYRGSMYRDALLVEVEDGSCAIFDFGVCVFWNCRQPVIDSLIE